MGTVIEVPAEPTLLGRFNPPPQRLRLPLRAGPRGSLFHVAAGLIGALFLFGAAAMLVAGPAFWLRSTRDALIFVAMFPFTAVMGLCSGAAALTAALDLTRSFPLMVLEEDTLLDKRLMRRPIPWSDVRRAKFTYTGGGVGGVHLQLRRTVEAFQNPFRLGTLGFYWRRRGDELHISVMTLDLTPHTLAHAIAALVRRHGGEADTDPPPLGWTWHASR
jgi:hypothetical protein